MTPGGRLLKLGLDVLTMMRYLLLMNIPTPAQVASNRTARLVAEATTPVYSTTTPEREHLEMVELEDDDYGYRAWHTMPTSEVAGFIALYTSRGYSLSDIDHAAKCWCQK